MVRRGRLSWLGHVECKSGDDWVCACRNAEVMGEKSRGKVKKTWRACVKDDMDEPGLHPEWAMWKGSLLGQTSNPG